MQTGVAAGTVPGQRDAALRVVVAEAMERMLRAREPFTALDISNGLKQRGFGVRHSEVAPVVRDLFSHGAQRLFGYDREMIEVNTEGGAKVTEAFLYLPANSLPSDYGRRVQDALPPVPADQARDLTAYVPVTPPVLLTAPGPTATGRRRGTGTRGKHRRDGALPIPKRLVAEQGWQVGDTLMLVPGASGDELQLLPLTADAHSELVQVRIWADLRVRVARTKLRQMLAGVAADATTAKVTPAGGDAALTICFASA